MDDEAAFDTWLQVLLKKPWKVKKLDELFPGQPEFVLRLRLALEEAKPDHDRVLVTGRPRKSEPGSPVRLPRDTVVGCRVDAIDLEAIDLLVEAGVRPTRSDAAAWFISQGIQANEALVEEVRGAVDEIRRLRERVQTRVRERTGELPDQTPEVGPAANEVGDEG